MSSGALIIAFLGAIIAFVRRAIVFAIALVAGPVAVLGRFQRAALSHVPFGLALRSSLVGLSLVAVSADDGLEHRGRA